MNVKILAIGIVGIMVVAGVGAAFLMNSNNGKDESILTHRLLVIGNVYSDDILDSKDVTVLEAVVNGEKSIEMNDYEIDLTNESLLKYADVNQDTRVDSADVDSLKKVISGDVTKLYYENAKGEIKGVTVPINNLVVLFRRIGTTIAMVGAADMVVGQIDDFKPNKNYGFLGFKGQYVGAGSDPNFEVIKGLDDTYASTGGVTVIADATGSAANIEEGVGSSIDVVRLPVTELGKSENGVVTLGFLLAYKNQKHDQIMDKLNKWIEWNDKATKKITEALKNLKDEDKKTCIVALYNTDQGATSINVRKASSSEYAYTVQCGGKNIYTGQSLDTIKDVNDYILQNKPEYFFIMQQEARLLAEKVPAQTTYDEIKGLISDNYTGKIGVFSQFFGTGPGYVLSLMYYASVLIPELSDAFDITAEYKYFMGTLVNNTELAEVPAFVTIH